MCNIAGYIGEKDAAPILLEMIRAQEMFDGGYTTGIATIHNGKIYMRKVMGDVNTLIKETDALSLPGKIGIAHTRPMNDTAEFAHPFISDNGKIAMVQNGTLRDVAHLSEQRNEIIEMLFEEGYKFTSRVKLDVHGYPKLHTGETVTTSDGGVNMVEYLMNKGKSACEALAEMMGGFYADLVAVMIQADNENDIGVCRISRPMYALIREDESYIATAPFGFPKELHNEKFISLPTMQSCRVYKGGVEEFPCFVEGEKVMPVTEDILKEAYGRVEKLINEKTYCCYDDVENFIYFECSDMWGEKHLITQCAPVAYEVLFKMYKEGRLKYEVRPVEGRNLLYFYF